MLIPSDPSEFPTIDYSNMNDNATIVAADVHLPVTFYVGLTNGDLAAAADALLGDLLPAAEGPAFGNFELTATER